MLRAIPEGVHFSFLRGELKIERECLDSIPTMNLERFTGSNDQNAPWDELLDIGHKVFKDPVYHEEEILVTSTETKIIDLPLFQRLQFIRQLGPSYLLYRSANHTRFEHSLGTLHQAERIIRAVNKNSQNKIDPRNHFLIRILALTHDVAHVPFSHMLEDDGGLFQAPPPPHHLQPAQVLNTPLALAFPFRIGSLW